MLANFLLENFQRIIKPVYDRSFVLQNIDWFIGASIFCLIFSSTFAQSDNIGYFAIFVMILTMVKILTKPNEKFALDTADKWLLVYFIFVLISLFGSTLFYLSLKGFFKTVTYLGFYISVIHYLKDNKNMIKYILMALGICAIGETVVAFHQNFISVSEISGWQDMSRLNPEEVMTRVYGSIKPYNPNLFGGYMIAIFPSTLLGIFMSLNKKHFKSAVLSAVISAAVLVAIVLTGCRGAYIALFAELILVGIFTYRMLEPFYKKLFKICAGLVSLIISFIVVSLPSLRARVFSIFAFRGDSSNSFRFNVYNSCIDMFKDNWLLGIGCGNQNFREIYGLYMKTGFDALSAYNIYLETAVESGIFALITFLGFLYCSISKAIKYIFKNNDENSIYLIIAVVSLAGMLVHGFVDTVFFRPQIQFVFWIMVGIIRVL